MSLVHLLTESNPVFKAYAIYNGVLALKVLAMAPLTGRLRFGKQNLHFAITSASLISLQNPVFTSFGYHSSVLGVKLLASVVSLQIIPHLYRKVKRMVFANPEDTKLTPHGKIIFTDPDVERVRRAHLNDLENIPVFWAVSFLYVLTDPKPDLAVNLFRVYTGARIIHTLVYAVWVVPQPARGLAFGVGLATTAYMAFSVISHFCRA